MIAKLTANDGASSEFFGDSVAISGDTLVVGAPGDDIFGKLSQGSAYVFSRSGVTWTLQQKPGKSVSKMHAKSATESLLA